MTRPSRSSFARWESTDSRATGWSAGRHLAVHAGDDRRRTVSAPAPTAARIWALALEPVGDVALDDRPGRLEHRAVGRVDALDVEREDPPERGEVVAEVAVVGRDHGRRAAQDQVAREEGPLLLEVVAEVVRGVARRVERVERDARRPRIIMPSSRRCIVTGRSASFRRASRRARAGRPGARRARRPCGRRAGASAGPGARRRGALRRGSRRSSATYSGTPAPVSMRRGCRAPTR